MKAIDRQVDEEFVEFEPITLLIGSEVRITAGIFEEVAEPVKLPSGGEIEHSGPVLSLSTQDIQGLKKQHQVLFGGESWWVKHIGINEIGRARIYLAKGKPNEAAPSLKNWS
ncbi:head-tail joining protein [Rouxiella sp. T17]|uniref:head-tail joining protein n=1 Tax=Rouxiella sp. T17 TaxID=3085684 RepID=UPI002FC78102